MTVASQAKPPRLAALDAAKGIAIVLVVVFHVCGSLISAGRLPDSALLRWLDLCVYTFHVPVFFFVAGMVLGDPRRSGYFADLARRLVYPYVVWSLLQGFLVASAGAAANNPIGAAEVLPSLVIHPGHQFWFLHALIVILALMGLAVRRGWSPAAILTTSVLVFVVTLAVPLPTDLRSIGLNAIYVATGYGIGRPTRLPPAWSAPPAFALIGIAVALGWHTVDGVWYLLAAPGILGTLALANRWPTAFLCTLGRASLAIYVAHVLAAVPGRVLSPALPIGIACGLGIPYLLWRVAEAWGLPIFRWQPLRDRARLGDDRPLRATA